MMPITNKDTPHSLVAQDYVPAKVPRICAEESPGCHMRVMECMYVLYRGSSSIRGVCNYHGLVTSSDYYSTYMVAATESLSSLWEYIETE